MSRWIVRAVMIFCGLAMLSAAALLLFQWDVAERSTLVVLLWLTLAGFVAFAVLLVIGTWRKWRKQQIARRSG